MNESLFGSQAARREDRSPFKTVLARVVSRPLPPPSAAPAQLSPVAAPVLTPPSPAAEQVAASPRAETQSSSTSFDAALLAILESPIHAHESAAGGFARKESELRQIFGTLGVIASRALHSRLSSPRSGDRLAPAFLRLTADRRARLINFLADARRREAMGGR
jgi:hypothetical protein